MLLIGVPASVTFLPAKEIRTTGRSGSNEDHVRAVHRVYAVMRCCIGSGSKRVDNVGIGDFFFFFILRRMGKNKALAHHTCAYFHTRRVSI